MSSPTPNADQVEAGLESGDATVPPVESAVEPPSALAVAAGVAELQKAKVSTITFDASAGVASERTGGTTVTEGRKINRQDVKNVFRGSATTGTVTRPQIERVRAMHDKIDEGVDFNFNYYSLLMVASVVAGLGLATDSSTTVISSMLLSPIMGPVIGMSYGLIIWDLKLIKRSMRNEIVSIIICVIFGLIIGLCCFWTQMADEWPTNEMLSRGTRTTFLAGFPIAFFSGLGVALSVLDDQTSSLVGVAISASLLPPAVNCGMMLIVALLKHESFAAVSFQYQDTHPLLGHHLDLKYGGYPTFAQMGIMSLLLTIANVVMVAIGATLMFRLKEVLPVKKKVFWDDLKIARRLYQGRALDSVTGDVITTERFAGIMVEERVNSD